MKDWEKALNVFLKDWKDRKDVTGILVCGSYITGRPSRHSDIDLHILLDKKVKWRERGNRIVAGILIEYFANPLRMYKIYMRGEFANRSRMDCHMFSTGKILFDRSGELTKLVGTAKAEMKRAFPRMNPDTVEQKKYHLWDARDNLEEVFEAKGPEFQMVYFNDLYELFDVYSRFLGFERLSIAKLRRLLESQKDKEKYRTPEFPDAVFRRRFLEAVREKSPFRMLSRYRALTGYVLKKMGGFRIDGWKLRTPSKR